MEITYLRQRSSRLERLLAQPAKALVQTRMAPLPVDHVWNVDVEIDLDIE